MEDGPRPSVERVEPALCFKLPSIKQIVQRPYGFPRRGLEEGLEILKQIKKDLGVPVVSDVMGKPIKWKKAAGSPRYHQIGFSLPPDGPARGSCPYRRVVNVKGQFWLRGT